MNVVANLIAAAVVYLLGAWFGLFPRNPTAVTGAVGTLLLLIAAPLSIGVVVAGRRRGTARGDPLVMRWGGVTLLLAGAGFVASGVSIGVTTFDGACFVAMGAGFALQGALTDWVGSDRFERRLTQKGGGRTPKR